MNVKGRNTQPHKGTEIDSKKLLIECIDYTD